MPNAIQTRGLGYRAGKFELRDLALNVPTGSIYGFLGPNGSGKTTTIRLLLGMTRALRGDIEVLGQKIPVEAPAALARTGYVPERPHVYPALTVDETIRLHSAFYPNWDHEWAGETRKRFDLPGDRRVGRLSKGEAGKLVIMLALAQKPELLILDEPTDGLDPMVRRDVMGAVLEYVSRSSATVFMSSHLVHELERMCDWVGVLDHGHLVAELPIETFKGGVKRLRLSGPLALKGDAPFQVLSRSDDALMAGESWVVRGWQDPMRSYLETQGVVVRDVLDLDLEEVFVELLRSSRQETK